MKPDWAKAIAAAEQDLQTLDREFATLRHCTQVSKDNVAYYASRADCVRVQANQARRLIGSAYLRMMNSGISHRRFLAFVKRHEVAD